MFASTSLSSLPITLKSLEAAWDEFIIVTSSDHILRDENHTYPEVKFITQSNEFIPRNLYLSRAEADWIFVIEPDEFVDEQTRKFLIRIRSDNSLTLDSDNFWLPRKWLHPADCNRVVTSEPHGTDVQCRFFRNTPQLSYASNLPLHSVPTGLSKKGQLLSNATIYTLELLLHDLHVRQTKVLQLSCLGLEDYSVKFYLPQGHNLEAVARPLAAPEVEASLVDLVPANVVTASQKIQTLAIAKPLVIIDGVFFQLYNTGIGRVWRSLLEQWSGTEFANHLIVLDRGMTFPRVTGIEYVDVAPYDYVHQDEERQRLQELLDHLQADVFISTYYSAPLTTPSVFMAYDMVPEVLGWPMDNPHWKAKHLALEVATACVSISQSTAKDLYRLFRRKATVAHCGVDASFQPVNSEGLQRRYGITKPYFLLVGGRSSYKNAMLFFLAFSGLADRDAYDVVCVGGGPVESYYRRVLGGQRIISLNLGEAELVAAYSGALALVYPSVYEGFGLPILEAMACGTPVICCHNSSLPEVAGDAGFWVEESDIEGMRRALVEVQDPDTRTRLVEKGLRQARKFSWQRMAEIVRQVLLEAALPVLKCLRHRNLLFQPDWNAEFEILVENLAEQIRNSVHESDVLLVVDGRNAAQAEEIFDAVMAHLLFTEGIEVDNAVLFTQTQEWCWKVLEFHLSTHASTG
jgi:glycosyltransferase involved in cell wall biosynthesis